MAFCPQCGNTVDPGQRFCAVCGRDLLGPEAAPQPATQPVAPTPTGMSPAGPPTTSGKAVVSLICGIFFVFLPAAIVAIIFGHLALSDIKKSYGRLQGQGLAVTGLVLGYLGIVAIPVILIIAAIAIPNLLRARIAANEASAIATTRAIVFAEQRYQTTYSGSGYACSLEALGGADSGGCSASAEHACLLSSELTSGRRAGYIFEIRSCGPTKYEVVAYPVSRNSSGRRAFCSDESGVVRGDDSGSADECLQSGHPLP